MIMFSELCFVLDSSSIEEPHQSIHRRDPPVGKLGGKSFTHVF